MLHLGPNGETLWETNALKMPYDAVPLADGGYLVNIIRARAVWQIAPDGQVITAWPVGGYPCSLQLLPNGCSLVAGWDDDIPGLVREFDTDGQCVWGIENLCWPWCAQRLEVGTTLIADAGTGRVAEVKKDGSEIWGIGERPALFDALGPVYCQRLDNGNTLVSIRRLSRVVELNSHGQAVWEVGPDLVATQYSAIRRSNGNTLIADQGHNHVIEIDLKQHIVWE